MVKEDVVVTTITVHSMEQNVIVVSILWAGYVLLFGVVAWRVYKSYRDVARDESSSGDTSRSLFYKLLGMALLSRIIFVPIQNAWDGEMIQLVAETLPQLMFASAWGLLVSFFSNLVATASGGVSSNKPSLLIDIAVYLMYIVLVVWYWWNDAAAVLLYALLCIVFAGSIWFPELFRSQTLGTLATIAGTTIGTFDSINHVLYCWSACIFTPSHFSGTDCSVIDGCILIFGSPKAVLNCSLRACYSS